jgi:hypothetical protein
VCEDLEQGQAAWKAARCTAGGQTRGAEARPRTKSEAESRGRCPCRCKKGAWKAACCMATCQMTHELPPRWGVHECGLDASVAASHSSFGLSIICLSVCLSGGLEVIRRHAPARYRPLQDRRPGRVSREVETRNDISSLETAFAVEDHAQNGDLRGWRLRHQRHQRLAPAPGIRSHTSRYAWL